MSYMHIENLYKAQEILLFKECFAMEKIHGTSAHISWKGAEDEQYRKIWKTYHKTGLSLAADKDAVMKELSRILEPDEMSMAFAVLASGEHDGRLSFFSGGANCEQFVKLFNAADLSAKLADKVGPNAVAVYGEAYGGKMQGMSKVYGSNLRFIAFEVKIGESHWLDVPEAEAFCAGLGIEFVHYKRIPAKLDTINLERDAPSVQAERNGCGNTCLREGIVLRPIREMVMNGARIIAKHKRDEFKETKTAREVDPAKRQLLEDAKAIADEWVTWERLNHILTSGEIEPVLGNTGAIIKKMAEDVLREAAGEIMESPEARKAIGTATALLFKKWLNEGIKE